MERLVKPSLLPRSFIPGQLFREAAFPTFFQWEHIAPDTESVVDCVLGYRSYIVPLGEIARFIFQGEYCGISPVLITEMKLWDINLFQSIQRLTKPY